TSRSGQVSIGVSAAVAEMAGDMVARGRKDAKCKTVGSDARRTVKNTASKNTRVERYFHCAGQKICLCCGNGLQCNLHTGSQLGSIRAKEYCFMLLIICDDS